MSRTLAVLLLVVATGAGCASSPSAASTGSPAEGPPPARTAVVDAGGVAIHVDDVGEGDRALVFVHGWMCDARVWTHQLPALAHVGRLVAIDLPGHGRSGKPERAETLGSQADDVAATLRALGIRRAVAVGHSNGTGVVLNLARRHPDLVSGLVVVEGAFVNVMSGQADQVLPRFSGEGGREAARATMVATLTPGRTREEVDAFLAMLDGVPHHSALATLAGSMDDGGWSTEPLDVPVLALMAQAPWWTDEYWASVQAWVPALETRIYPGATHMLMFDRPDDVNAEIEAFVRGRGLLD